MKIIYKIFFLLLFFSSLFLKEAGGEALAQNHNIDSLQALIKNDKADTNKVNHLNKLYWEYRNIAQNDSAMYFANFALHLAQQLNFKKGIAVSYKNIGVIYYYQGNFSKALENYFASLSINKNLNDKLSIGISYNNIGAVYFLQGNYTEALKYYFASLKISDEIADKIGIASSYNNIGNIYSEQGNYLDALKNHIASLKIKEQLKDEHGIANSLGSIGNDYMDQNNYAEALKNYLASLKISEKIGDINGVANLYSSIGTIHQCQANYPEALKYHFASLKIMKEIGNKDGISNSFINIGFLYTTLNKQNEAKNYLNKALQLSKEIGNKGYIKGAYKGLATLDSTQGEWKDANTHRALYILYKDSLENEDTNRKILQATNKYEYETEEEIAKADQKNKIDKQQFLAKAESEKHHMVLLFVGIGVMLAAAFAGFIVRSLRITQKQKTIIEEKNNLVEEKNKTIEEKNNDITSSIRYAKRIQNALLKEENHVSMHLPEHFVLFMPKDIVSGDFYWAAEKMPFPLGRIGDGPYWYFAAVDCTGHGVPGAFMSMLGMSFLNQIISSKELLSPSEILNRLRDKVIEELRQTGEENGNKDGMDISLVRLNLQTMELQWSGANNSLHIIHDGKLEIIKADKQPIGYHTESHSFTNHEKQLEQGDCIYVFTDGYADQFGGPKGKKFKYKQLEDLILANSDKQMIQQKELLKSHIIDWKGDLEQVDDVCMIGVRV